jgi:branched-chain amino acid transport system ATP-binding protein
VSDGSTVSDRDLMLEVDDVHTFYGDSYVLQGVSIEVPRGTVMGVLGRNGVGKTTLIRTIIGFTRPRRGTVTFAGQDVTSLGPYAISHLGMALVPQGRRIFPSLSVLENLMLGARRGGADGETGWTLESVLELFPRLQARLQHAGNALSGGEQQMLAEGRALMTNPRLLLLDEPSEGLAPLLVRALGDVLVELKTRRLSVLLVEQNLQLALRVCDRVHILNRGRVVHTASPEALREDREIKTRFLGV